MLSKIRREEILENLAYNDLKLERGEVSHHHIYKKYKNDVESLFDEVLRLETLLEENEVYAGYIDPKTEMEYRADEILRNNK